MFDFGVPGLQKVEMRLSDSLRAVQSHLVRGPRPGAVARVPRPGNSLAGSGSQRLSGLIHPDSENGTLLDSRTDKGSPGHMDNKRPKIHRPVGTVLLDPSCAIPSG